MSALFSSEFLFSQLVQIRERRPLVHCLTNAVSMDIVANGLLSLGAAPVMAHASEELQEMIDLASSVYLNIGTLDAPWISSLVEALALSKRLKKPCVFDPVGSGATQFRTRVSHQVLASGAVHLLRGNASEILSLSGSEVRTKGVDSLHDSRDMEMAARGLAQQYRCAVVVSGERDLVTDGKRVVWVNHGHAMMTRVTGMGCLSSAVCAAFLALEEDSVFAGVLAMTVMGICGEQVFRFQPDCGPGRFKAEFLDRMFHLTLAEVKSYEL